MVKSILFTNLFRTVATDWKLIANNCFPFLVALRNFKLIANNCFPFFGCIAVALATCLQLLKCRYCARSLDYAEDYQLYFNFIEKFSSAFWRKSCELGNLFIVSFALVLVVGFGQQFLVPAVSRINCIM